MAAMDSARTSSARRPLPKLTAGEQVEESNEDTPRTFASDESARERRRTQQRRTRQQISDPDEAAASSTRTEARILFTCDCKRQ
jgi:hypothetical protein